MTIFGEAIHEVNKLIAQDRRKSTKLTYLEDLDENGHPIYLTVDSSMQIGSVDEYAFYESAFEDMGLLDNQRKLLTYRLKGLGCGDSRYGYKSIAKKEGVTPKAIRNRMQKIAVKAVSAGYGKPEWLAGGELPKYIKK